MKGEPDKPDSSPTPLSYFHPAPATHRTVTRVERWLPIMTSLVGCLSFWISRGSDVSPAGSIVFFYFMGVAIVLAVDAVRRPGLGWGISLGGLIVACTMLATVLGYFALSSLF